MCNKRFRLPHQPAFLPFLPPLSTSCTVPPREFPNLNQCTKVKDHELSQLVAQSQLGSVMLRTLIVALLCACASALQLGSPARVAPRGSAVTMAAAKIRMGDMVKVLSGDDKGKVAKVRRGLHLPPARQCQLRSRARSWFETSCSLWPDFVGCRQRCRRSSKLLTRCSPKLLTRC